MTEPSIRPMLSVGLAVFNGEDTLERCLDSVLGQDFSDFEIVVSDNASTDGTSSILRRYSDLDGRVKVFRNPENIGQQPNMNRVFDLARGQLYRWISVDDWLEPQCLSASVEALEARSDAVGVTSYFRIHTDDGLTRYEEYGGEFPDSPDPVRRFDRMLWFFHAGDEFHDPMYAVYRRSALERTPRLRVSERADWLLVTELALLGPIGHVRRCLSNRTRVYGVDRDRKAYLSRLHPEQPENAASSALRLHRDLRDIVRASDLTDDQKEACERRLRRFTVAEIALRARTRVRRAGGDVARRAGLLKSRS